MRHPLRIGHIALLGSAPLLVAQDRDAFSRESVSARLSCELGFAALCAKLADQKLDGACLPAPLAIMLAAGAGVARVPLRLAAICSWQGIGLVLPRLQTKHANEVTPPRIGVLSPGTPCRLFLQKLAHHSPRSAPADYTQIPVAASQLNEFLAEGMIDGICGYDPLPALACLEENVNLVSDSSVLFPAHPGCVLVMRTDAVEGREHLLDSLARVVERAREYCTAPGGQAAAARLVLAQAPYARISPARLARLSPNLGTTQFAVPASERAGLSAASVDYLEMASLSAAGPAARIQDIRAALPGLLARPSLAAVAGN